MRRSNKIESTILLQSLLVGFFADIKCINWSLTYGGFVGEGMMGILYPFVAVLVFVMAVVGNNDLKKRFHVLFGFLLLWIIGFYVFTQSFIGPPRAPLAMFGIFVVLALLIPNLLTVNVRVMIKSMMFYPFFAIFRLNQVFASQSSWQDVISMEASYGFLVPIVATIGYLFLYYKEEKKFDKVITLTLAAINAVYFYQILLYGSRGPILCVLLLVLFMWVVRINKTGVGTKLPKSRLIISIISIAMVVLFFFPLLGIISNHTSSFHAIEKIYRLSSEGDITNGREAIAGIALRLFLDSPIYGHGLDRFEANTGIVYPHNFILQILYDGGIILFFTLFVPVIIGAKNILKKCTRDEYAAFVVLLFASVPGAMFSGDMWLLSILWLFFGYSLSKNFVKNVPVVHDTNRNIVKIK